MAIASTGAVSLSGTADRSLVPPGRGGGVGRSIHFAKTRVR